MVQTNKYGNTSSALAFATQSAIEHNIKVLLISTSINDSLINDSFWRKKKKKPILDVFSATTVGFDQDGIEGLDRVIRSNKLTPEIIKDYTKIVLSGRLEILPGLEGTREQFNMIKDRYHQIIPIASKYYDLVVVDLDKNVGLQTEIDILKTADIIVAMVTQRINQIRIVQQTINSSNILKDKNTIITIGRYMDDTKYNIKNISRNILKTKELVNVIPYSNLFFEASQEGSMVDLFLALMRVKEGEKEYGFVQELKRLYDTISHKLK